MAFALSFFTLRNHERRRETIAITNLLYRSRVVNIDYPSKDGSVAYTKVMQAISHANPRTQINVKLIKQYITIHFEKNED